MIVTCEHGGNEIPSEYSQHFASAGAAADLRSHRGYDPGALKAAKFMAEHFNVKLISSTVTRLLVDLNRSEDNLGLLSKYSSRLDANQRHRLLERYYRPYRKRVLERVGQVIATRQVAVHLSVHTFTPRFRGTRRDVDLGILFDPNRKRESELARRWCENLQSCLPRSRVRENQPYLGTDDGLTTWLRTQFDQDQYFGIEIEIANSFAKRSATSQLKTLNILCSALVTARIATDAS